MKFLLVAAHLTSIWFLITHTAPVTSSKAERYCYGYVPHWPAAFPCAWIPIEIDV